MKRPLAPDVSASPRRKRALSEEERALWEAVAKQTKPLRKKPRIAKPQLASPDTPAVAMTATSQKPHPVAKKSQGSKTYAPPAAPPLAPLGRRERWRLSRGRMQIDARLDLHGMTLTRAHRDGLTFVLVITGKGRATGAESGRGVLRREVPQWLGLPEFRSLVVGFEEAHIGHGGEGALYVRIRRSKV